MRSERGDNRRPSRSPNRGVTVACLYLFCDLMHSVEQICPLEVGRN